MVDLSEFKVSNYPDGHRHVVSNVDLKGDKILSVRLKSFDDLFLVAQVRRIHPELTTLNILYMLGARCDRRFSPGEAVDIEIVCDYINSMAWKSVIVVKPHSDKTIECLKNAVVHDPTEALIRNVREDLTEGTICFVSPDEGASKWIHHVKPALEPIIQCSKKRNKEGAVVGVGFMGCHKMDYDNFVIVDDLCDGGGTFTAIAREIRLQNPQAKVYLVVTHAIFSKGFEPFEGLIDRIYCTNSFADFDNPLVKQMKLGV